jgi:hypothetical protein
MPGRYVPVAMSVDKKSGVQASQIAVAALAAVTAAVLGSTLGVAGTILGAALGAIVSTVTTELYARSYERVRYRVGKSTDESQEQKEEKPTRRVRWQLLAGVSIAAFVLGMIVITGIEWVRGEPLSGDAQTTIGGVLQRPDHTPHIPTSPDKTPAPTTVTVTPSTTTPPPTVTSERPPASGTSSSSPSSTTTTTTDPVQPSAGSQEPSAP